MAPVSACGPHTWGRRTARPSPQRTGGAPRAWPCRHRCTAAGAARCPRGSCSPGGSSSSASAPGCPPPRTRGPARASQVGGTPRGTSSIKRCSKSASVTQAVCLKVHLRLHDGQGLGRLPPAAQLPLGQVAVVVVVLLRGNVTRRPVYTQQQLLSPAPRGSEAAQGVPSPCSTRPCHRRR